MAVSTQPTELFTENGDIVGQQSQPLLSRLTSFFMNPGKPARPNFRQWAGLPLRHAQQLRRIQTALRQEWASAPSVQGNLAQQEPSQRKRWASLERLKPEKSNQPLRPSLLSPIHSVEKRALEFILSGTISSKAEEPRFNTAVSAIHEGLDELFPRRYPQYASPDKSYKKQTGQVKNPAKPIKGNAPPLKLAPDPNEPSSANYRSNNSTIDKLPVLETAPSFDPLLEFSPTVIKTSQEPPSSFVGKTLPSKPILSDSIFCPGLTNSKASSRKQETHWASKPESLLSIPRLIGKKQPDNLKSWGQEPKHGVTRMGNVNISKGIAYSV